MIKSMRRLLNHGCPDQRFPNHWALASAGVTQEEYAAFLKSSGKEVIKFPAGMGHITNIEMLLLCPC